MRSTLFNPKKTLCKEINGLYEQEFFVPTLNAYAITHIVGHFGPLTVPISLESISDNKITVSTEYDLCENEFNISVFYIGIRDYRLFFHNVTDASLKARLGSLYEEMDKAFENQSWLSFMLMAGAVIEGVLHNEIGGSNDNLHNLIENSAKRGLIADKDRILLHYVRNYRNIVHASNHNSPYVNREHAMDARVLVNRLLRDVCRA